MSRVDLFCVIVTWIACIGEARGQIPNPPAQLTAAEIRAQLRQTNDRVRNYRVAYHTVPSKRGVNSPSTYIRREIAASQPSFFFHWSAKGSELNRPDDDVFQQRLKIGDGIAVNEYPCDRAFVSAPMPLRAPLPGTIPGEIIFFVLGWWPLDSIKPPQAIPGAATTYSEIAASDDYVLHPAQELVHNRWCHVLELPGHDRIWINFDNGTRLAAREGMDPHSGNVLRRIEIISDVEVSPSLWAPTRFLSVDHPQIGDRRDLFKTEFVIDQIDVNVTFSPSMFRFEPLRGAIELLSANHFEQRVPNGSDHLDDLVNRLEAISTFRRGHAISEVNLSFLAITNTISSICVIGIVKLNGSRSIRRGDKPIGGE